MINHIAVTNVNGLDFAFDLAPVNVVVGDNFEGKTALLNAVRIAMLGHLPKLGKQPASTMKLAFEHRPEMTVNAQFDGVPVLQKWTRNKKGGASWDVEGELLDIPPELLDINEFLTKTKADRIKFVFEKINLDKFGFSDDEILERLGKIETTPAAISVVAVDAMKRFAHASIAERTKFKLTHQNWLEKLIATLKSEMTAFKNTAEYNSSQQVTLRKQMPEKTPKSVEDKLLAKEKELDGYRTQTRQIKEAFERWQQTEKRRGELDILLSKPAPNPEPLRLAMLDLGQTISKATSVLKEHERALLTLRERRRSNMVKVTSLKAEIDGYQARLTEITSKTACPTCKSKRQGWQDEVKSEFEAAITYKQGELHTLTHEIEKIDREGIGAKKLVEDAEKEQAKLQAELEAKNKAYSQEQIAEATYAGAVKERQNLEQALPKPDTEPLLALDESISVLNREVDALKIEQAAFNSFEKMKARKDEVEAESIKQSVHQKVFKMAVEEILKIQEEMIATAIGDVLDKAQPITEGILKAPLEFKGGELGYTWNNGWVSYETFSGTEEALSFAAFSFALTQESPLKIIIIDEMDRIKGSRRQLFLQRMLDLVKAKAIDQFIGAGIESEVYEQVPGVNVIKVKITS